jgi:uncharacterized membrane protein
VNARPEQASPEHAHVMEPIEHAIRRILLCGIALSVALMAVGLVLGVAQGAGLPRGVVPLADLPGALAALRPAAYLSLGLIVLIGTPFVRVAGSLVIFARARDGRYVLVTAIVLFVMCLGVALGRI